MKITLLAGALLLGVYAVLRLGFYASNRAYFEGVPAPEIALAFVHGVRFDIAGLILLNLPVLVLLNVPLPAVKPRWYLRIAAVLFALVNAVGLLVNVFDFGYYASVQRRTLFEPLQHPEALLWNAGNWFEEYTTLFVGGLAGIAVVTTALTWCLRGAYRRMPETRGRVRGHFWALVLLALCVIGVRGGLQAGVMRPADAFVYSPSYAVGNMTLNSTYTAIVGSILPRLPVVRTMDEEEAFRIALAMVVEPGEEMLDPRYPFLRRRAPAKDRVRANIVVLMMESWTAAEVGPDASGNSRTPFFDALAREGALYTNFLANGQRSCEAVTSITASVPSVFPRPIIGSRSELVRFRGLGDVLVGAGYDVSFHHGAAPSIEGFDGFTKLVGFGRYYSRDDYRGPIDENSSDGRWGIYDEPFFLDSAKRLDEAALPFLAVLFGLAPHDPYRLPPNREHVFAQYASESPYRQMLRYSDYSLRRFFDYARTRPWFRNTVFFIVADHARFSPPDSFYEAFHVPLLIYGPNFIRPAVQDGVASHVDLLPTILDLLGLPARHASIGRSVLAEGQPRYSVVQRTGRYVIFGDRYACMHDLRRALGLYDYRADPRFRRDLSQARPEVVEALQRRLFAYLQAVTTVVSEDRVWPRER